MGATQPQPAAKSRFTDRSALSAPDAHAEGGVRRTARRWIGETPPEPGARSRCADRSAAGTHRLRATIEARAATRRRMIEEALT
jgi:hypothetical protein